MNTKHQLSDHSSTTPGRVRPRRLALLWLLASRPRRLGLSLVSHLGVAMLTAAVLTLLRPPPGPCLADSPCGLVLGRSPAPDSEHPAPSEMSVELRGGVPSGDGRPNLHTFGPEDVLGIVVRHNGRRSDEARLLVTAQLLTGPDLTYAEGPEIFVSLDPRRVVWKGQSLHYKGKAGSILPLRRGLWRLTFSISDPRECEASDLFICSSTEAWLRLA